MCRHTSSMHAIDSLQRHMDLKIKAEADSISAELSRDNMKYGFTDEAGHPKKK